ncbi:MAG: ABC transporter substrate-binding protein/permease [Bacteroidales bacterium]|nr:ABC transporter substrate-binding protein/permease [Bacteroidales bacterium]
MKYCIKVVILFIALALSGCNEKDPAITDLDMLKGGKTFAVPTGTVADQFVLKKFPDAKLEYYNSVLDCAIAVKDGKADGAVYDLPVLKNIVAKNDGIVVLPELLFNDQYGFAVRLQDTVLKNTIDNVLDTLKVNGTYEDMKLRWFPEKGDPAPMPVIPLDGKNGILKFGTAAITEPMAFVDGNKNVVGFDVEFATYIARQSGKQLEIVDMEFGALLPALIAGKVDMIGAGLSITDERAKKVLFSECYYPSGIAVVVREKKQEGVRKPSMALKSIKDIRNKRIGVLLGSIHDAYAIKTFPDATILQFQTVSDLLFAINSGKTDVGFFDQTSLKDIFSKNQELGILTENLFSVPIAAGFNKEDVNLREQFNKFLKEIRGNGIYKDMCDRWMVKGVMEMPEIKDNAVNGTLRTGVVSDLGMPFTILKDGHLVGFDIELATRFAAYVGKEYVPVDMPFGSLLAAISTNKIDLITSSLMITDERKKQIDFSDPYYESGVSIIAKKTNLDPSVLKKYSAANGTDAGSSVKKSFWTKISDSFYSNIILEKRYLHIIDGLRVTLLITILAAVLGTMIGGLICFMRMSRDKIMSGFAKGYISLLRGTPVLVLLMIIYYIVFASVNINPVIVAILAFGLNFGAYVSEMFRTGIESIDKGQREAAIAGGFTKVQAFLHIILPQALRRALPIYKGEFISLLKMTSIVGYIAVQDLTKAGDIIRSRTFDAFFPLIMIAVLYLLIAWSLTWALGRIEFSVDPIRKRAKRSREETK